MTSVVNFIVRNQEFVLACIVIAYVISLIGQGIKRIISIAGPIAIAFVFFASLGVTPADIIEFPSKLIEYFRATNGDINIIVDDFIKISFEAGEIIRHQAEIVSAWLEEIFLNNPNI